jgi:hypothetical protein
MADRVWVVAGIDGGVGGGWVGLGTGMKDVCSTLVVYGQPRG